MSIHNWQHSLNIGISLLQEWWRWHYYSHTDYLCLNIHQVTFITTLEAHISKTKQDRNKRIADSESRHLDDCMWLRGRPICKSNIHAQRDAPKQFYLPPYYLKQVIINKLWNKTESFITKVSLKSLIFIISNSTERWE